MTPAERTAARRAAIREMHAAGRTRQEIAKALGCGLSTVERDESAMGLARGGTIAAYRRRAAEKRRRIKQAATLDHQGVPVDRIAERMGVAPRTILGYLRTDEAADVHRELARKAEREVALPPGRWVPVRRNGLVVQVYVTEEVA